MSTSLERLNDVIEALQAPEEPVEPAQRLMLDAGNYATLENGLIKLFLKGDREIFSVDGSTIPFEKKQLTATMQVYLLGFGHGRGQEKESLKIKLGNLFSIIFD
jgi:hypothetical protein